MGIITLNSTLSPRCPVLLGSGDAATWTGVSLLAPLIVTSRRSRLVSCMVWSFSVCSRDLRASIRLRSASSVFSRSASVASSSSPSDISRSPSSLVAARCLPLGRSRWWLMCADSGGSSVWLSRSCSGSVDNIRADPVEDPFDPESDDTPRVPSSRGLPQPLHDPRWVFASCSPRTVNKFRNWFRFASMLPQPTGDITEPADDTRTPISCWPFGNLRQLDYTSNGVCAENLFYTTRIRVKDVRNPTRLKLVSIIPSQQLQRLTFDVQSDRLTVDASSTNALKPGFRKSHRQPDGLCREVVHWVSLMRWSSDKTAQVQSRCTAVDVPFVDY